MCINRNNQCINPHTLRDTKDTNKLSYTYNYLYLAFFSLHSSLSTHTRAISFSLRFSLCIKNMHTYRFIYIDDVTLTKYISITLYLSIDLCLSICICLCDWIWKVFIMIALVSMFNGILTIMGYLMPKPSL